jgi:membrane protein
MHAEGEGRIHRWVRRHPLRIGGTSSSLLAVRAAERFLEVRVMGLAAEMTYYALLSIFPLLGALGASLGFLERFIGPEQVEAAESAVILGLDAVFSQEVTADVVAPLVQGLLRHERAGFAVGSFLLTLFFASRYFRSVITSLDSTYAVEERRGTVALWSLGLGFALGAVVAATTVLSMVVIGPLLGGGRAIAGWLGLGAVFEAAWAVLRWPTVFVIATAFLALVYRYGPNVRNTWRESLPGALFGMLALVLVAVGFRVYVEATGLQSPAIDDADAAVSLALHMVGALMAGLLWLWLSSMVILSGGVLNAELSRLQHGLPPQKE